MNQADKALDQDITRYFQSQQLDSKSLEFLLSQKQVRGSKRWMAIAVAAVLSFVVLGFTHLQSARQIKTELVQKEVAMNHVEKLKVDFEAEDLAALDQQMSSLPFKLSMPGKIKDHWQMVGARYCSLSGVLAAHVRYKDPSTDKQYSVFVTEDSHATFDINNQPAHLNDVSVALWREKGYLFAMAQATGAK